MKKLARIYATVLLIGTVLALSWPRSDVLAVDTNPGATDLQACWDLDEESGVRYDAYGDNDLTDNNTVGFAAGVVGNAASFVSFDFEYLSIADNPALSMGDIDFTIFSWVYPQGTTGYILAKRNTATASTEYGLYIASGVLYFRVGNNTTSQPISSGSLSLNTWYFVAARHDSVNDLLHLSINNSPITPVSYSSGSYDSANSLTIGSNRGTASFLDGYIDETGIYKRALSDDEISWLYNSGAGRACSELNPPPTETPTNTITETPTETLTPTFTFTPSNTPTETPTLTPSPTFGIQRSMTAGDMFLINIIAIGGLILLALVVTIAILLALRRRS